MNDHEVAPITTFTPTSTTATASNVSTLTTLDTGDVLELEVDGGAVTALVLLATDHALILDACDGSTPFVVRRDELGPHRRFNPNG